MSKKPADQQSPNGESGEAIDLGVDLGDEGGAGGNDGEDDDDDNGEGGEGEGGKKTLEQLVAAGIAAALPQIQASFQSEMDRRINGAVKKVAGKTPAPKDGDNDEDPVAAPVADVRGARVAFREYLPDEIKFFSTEERELGMAFGQSQIKAAALAGFDDEDEVGKNVATATAEFIKKARNLYSARTRRVLKQQGALKDQPAGPAGTGGDAPDSLAAIRQAAEKKDRELFPERYRDK